MTEFAIFMLIFFGLVFVASLLVILLIWFARWLLFGDLK